MQPDQPGSSPRPRVGWIDAARGIGIVLVVYGHALRSQVASGAAPDYWHAATQDVFIYAFHMPLFFVLAGLNFERAAEKDWWEFFKERLVTLAWPYLLWSTISWGISYGASSRVNDPLTVDALLNIWWDPILQYWFLYILFFLCLVAYPLMRARIILFGAALWCALFFGPIGHIVGRIEYFYVYFAAGIALAWLRRQSRVSLSPAQWIQVAVVLGAFFAVLAHNQRVPETIQGKLLMEFIAFCGLGTLMALCIAAGNRLPKWLMLLGQASMAIYVLHTIVSSAVRILFSALLPGFSTLSLIVATIAGLVFPLIACLVAGRLGISVALGMGRPLRLGSTKVEAVPEKEPG